MSKQADVQVPEEAVEALRDMEWAASCSVTDPPGGKDSVEWACIRLEAALPSLLDHFRKRLLSDEAIAAAARRRHPLFASYILEAKVQAVQEARRDLEAASATAFQDNTDSQGGKQ